MELKPPRKTVKMYRSRVQHHQLDRGVQRNELKLLQDSNDELYNKYRVSRQEHQSLLKYVKTKLSPELKLYHNSKVHIGIRGGGGKAAVDSFNELQAQAKAIILSYGFVEDTDDNPRPQTFKKNVDVLGMRIHFVLNTLSNKQINVVLQSQKKNGGAHVKAVYSVETMIKIGGHFILLYESTIAQARNETNNAIKNSGMGPSLDPNDFGIFAKYTLNTFRSYLRENLQ